MLSDSGESSARVQLWRSRWDEILNDGLGREADVRWFTAEQGFLLVCRELPRQDLTDLCSDPMFDALLADLDDRLVAFSGPLPSDRARALVDVALAEGPAAVLPESRAALTPAGGDPYDETINAQVDGIVTDLRQWFAAGSGAEGRRRHDVPIVVSHHARGDVVLITVREHPVAGVAPDLVQAPFQRIDAHFAHAVEHAMAATGTGGGVRYVVQSRRTGAPVDAIGGRSVGLGAALALRRLHDAKAAPLDPDWVFTGAVEVDGSVTSLLGAEGASEYGAKLSAIDRGALVYPAADQTEVERLGELRAPDLRLEPVATIADAERLASRHVEGRRAYQRAVEPGHPVSKLAIVAIAALGLVLAWMWLSHHRQIADERQRRADAAGLAPAAVTIADGAAGLETFSIDRTEVSNRQYAICMAAGECPAPDSLSQERPIIDPANGAYPVTGVAANDGEIFCRWARGEDWGLPSHAQYVAVVAQDVSFEYPHGDTIPATPPEPGVDLPAAIQPAAGQAAGFNGIASVVGNVAEWTRTQCTAAGCFPVASVQDLPAADLSLFGLSFDLLRSGYEVTSTDWLTDPAYPDLITGNDTRMPWLGFRCATDMIPIEEHAHA